MAGIQNFANFFVRPACLLFGLLSTCADVHMVLLSCCFHVITGTTHSGDRGTDMQFITNVRLNECKLNTCKCFPVLCGTRKFTFSFCRLLPLTIVDVKLLTVQLTFIFCSKVQCNAHSTVFNSGFQCTLDDGTNVASRRKKRQAVFGIRRSLY